MNNPFDYTPSEQMLEAQARLSEKIECLCRKDEAFAEEVSKGKMFGILLAETTDIPSRQLVLTAYSGQICGQFGIYGFVPAVFDYLAPDGYFKTHEAEISALNRRISDMLKSPELAGRKHALAQLVRSAKADIEAYKELMRGAKIERDLIRGKGIRPDSELIRESQFMKAELRRKRLLWKEKTDAAKSDIESMENEIRLLRLRRQQMSDSLQRWLFSNFFFTNSRGVRRSLSDIWQAYFKKQENAKYRPSLPPSGSGECCEPKLLNYAYTHGMKPLEIGMFWWGASPKGEVRHHGRFYPACNGKCKPILHFLLDGEKFLTDDDSRCQELKIIYEDAVIIVVDKPAGMLSVPGKGSRESVYSILRQSRSDCPELQMVHRLDMDTSGLLVVAKTKAAHKALQRQFAERVTKKIYTALLEENFSGHGSVTLKLAADCHDRPRQKVDEENGKEAMTEYKSLGKNRVELIPLTGRTHQLRVHCAHADGLNNPILGDRLYGRRAERLFLHASVLSFLHPETGERLTFTSPPPF
jgi:tRNA pseudouridine32 synthase/23S rRNA pseudouridine746 synthase